MRMYTTSDKNSKRKTVQSTTSGIVYVCCNKVYIIGIGKICRACTMVYNRFTQMVIKDFAKQPKHVWICCM